MVPSDTEFTSRGNISLPMSATTEVTINVIDVNDNKPIFYRYVILSSNLFRCYVVIFVSVMDGFRGGAPPLSPASMWWPT